jgi:DNA-binding MarR family transcriptional regulator
MNSKSIATSTVANYRPVKLANVNGKLLGYPPSAKLVFKALEQAGAMTLKDIENETYLPYRTVRYAVKRLKDGGLVTRIFHVQDARQSVYRLAQ